MKTFRKTLESLIETVNVITKSPAVPYTRKGKNGPLKANVGNFHLSQAYGGYCVHRMANDSGGVLTPLMYGHVPAAECEAALRAFIQGLDFMRKEKRDRAARRTAAKPEPAYRTKPWNADKATA